MIDPTSVHSGMRKRSKASFVRIKKERFKYSVVFNLLNKLKHTSIHKIASGKLKGYFHLFFLHFDAKSAVKDSIMWLTNAFVEGLLINIALYSIFDFHINTLTILSYGIITRKTVEIVQELRNNGTNPKVSYTNK